MLCWYCWLLIVSRRMILTVLMLFYSAVCIETHLLCVCISTEQSDLFVHVYAWFFFKDVFKYPLIIKVPFYFAIISWHALVFCSLSRHWYLRSQSLTSWMIHTPKVKCSKDPDCHRRCGIFTKIIFTCWKNFQDTGMY